MRRSLTLSILASGLLAACAFAAPRNHAQATQDYYGTLEPFASQAVYFVMTDRFVNGDPANDQRDQGGALHTFNIPLPPCNGVSGNIGYMGGDFKGIADHLDYIHAMGFTSV